MTKNFVLMSALRGANANPYAVLLDVDINSIKGSCFLHKPINANVISFDQARAIF